MSYIKKTVTSGSSELSFIQGFITSLTNADRRITCLTNDLAEQFADENCKPSFSLSIDGACTITFTRKQYLSISDNAYFIKDDRSRFNTECSFSTTTEDHSDDAVRTFKYRIISNGSVLCLEFTGHEGDFVQPLVCLVCVRQEQTVFSSAMTEHIQAMDNCFYGTDGSVLSKTDRLPYIYEPDVPENVEIIKSKVFVTVNSDDRQLTSGMLYDISSVCGRSLMSIGGKYYYALDAHTVMEV